MRAFRHQPIRRKLLLVLVAAAVAVLTLTMGGIVIYELTTYRQRLVEQMSRTARFIAANSAPALAFDDPHTAREILTTLAAYPEVTLAVLYSAQGGVLASFHPGRELAIVPTHPPAEGFRAAGRQFELVHPVVQRGRRLGTLLLSATPANLPPRLAAYAGILLVVALAIGGGALILQRLLQWMVSAPLRQLAQTAERIAGGDLTARVPERTEDEIGQLASAFNHMAGQLAQSYAELEQRVEARTAELSAANRELEAFTYSVSHDLRAPLRHLESFAELLAAESGPSLDAQGRHYVEIIAESARRMGVMIDDLLDFSRLGRTTLRAVPVDLMQLVEEARRELA
ncbi:MAG: HAMP domain-containing protein, partial [Desulfuromonadales bacterium]